MSRLRPRLRWQLMLSYLPLVLIPIVVMGIVIRSVAQQSLTVLVTLEAERRAKSYVDSFSEYYATHGSWQGVETLISQSIQAALIKDSSGIVTIAQGMQPPVVFSQVAGGSAGGSDAAPVIGIGQANLGLEGQTILISSASVVGPEQILIVDRSGKIVAGGDPALVGQTVAQDVLAHGAEITLDGKAIDTLVIGAAFGILDPQQQQLLDRISTALWVSSGFSVLVTVGIGLWFSRQMTAPIQQLTQGARRLMNGKWDAPLPVRSRNEFGDLTNAFNQMVAEMLCQQNMRRQMVADIAHDLRTPLSVMTLEVEGIRAGIQTPQDAANSLEEEIDWLSRLVEDLHTLSLMDAGQLELQCQPANLNPFLESLYEQWKTIAAKEKRQFSAQFAANLPLVSLDTLRMRQVLGNLLNNAFQHTPPEAQVSLKARTEHGKVLLEVEDSGQGIPPDDIPHIFDRFYRVDRSRRRNMHRGSGLGLSIAYQLVALQNGNLLVRSEPGKGATFTVVIPILEARSMGNFHLRFDEVS